MQDLARIEAVRATGPSTLAITRTDGSASTVDLAGRIARGGRRFAALGSACVFAGVKSGLYGGNATWDKASEIRRFHDVPRDADA